MIGRFRILPANIVVLAIGLVDLLTTIFWLNTGRAIEVNPLMAAILTVSMPLFVAVKLSTLGAYVLVVEWYRRHRNPCFARQISALTVIAYLGIYTVSFCAVNHKILLG